MRQDTEFKRVVLWMGAAIIAGSWVVQVACAALIAWALVYAKPAQADELYTAAKLRTAECVALQLKDSHGGRKLGDVVAFEADGQPVRGVVRAFRCEHGYTGRDAVLIERTDDPFQPWAYTRAMESVK